MAEENFVAEATRRRRRSSRASFFFENASYDIKTLREDCHVAEENFVAEATRRRRRSLRVSAFLLLGSAYWERRACREAFFLVYGKEFIKGVFGNFCGSSWKRAVESFFS